MCIDTITWKIQNFSFYVFNLNIHTKTGSCWFFFWYHPIFSTTLIRSLLLFPPTRITLRDYVSQFFRIIYSLNVVPNWISFNTTCCYTINLTYCCHLNHRGLWFEKLKCHLSCMFVHLLYFLFSALHEYGQEDKWSFCLGCNLYSI